MAINGNRTSSVAGRATIELEVSGMHCESCVVLIEEALSADPGVSQASVELETAHASIVFDPQALSVDDLCAVVAGLGYQAAPLHSGPPGP